MRPADVERDAASTQFEPLIFRLRANSANRFPGPCIGVPIQSNSMPMNKLRPICSSGLFTVLRYPPAHRAIRLLAGSARMPLRSPARSARPWRSETVGTAARIRLSTQSAAARSRGEGKSARRSEVRREGWTSLETATSAVRHSLSVSLCFTACCEMPSTGLYRLGA